ncbi:MAG: tRNA (adenosine(37)-N6)-threonylcarbamoyltransferase complex dimerization subunit type 1 TsaB [Acidobacteria bacterium]|nr:tRNA (adenosine(37)-N6)-threonylcarbamoyltransferase complex dimerization subunit type 1 TsaB [Acidobacteriota bacterium]
MSDSLVLAIDTTAEFGSLALAEGNSVIEEVLMHSTDGYGHVLFERIDALLTARGVKLQDIALFAAAAGPGSFTGVRVGLAAAKGLAAAMGKPAAGVSNLQALALLGEGSRRAAVLDARRGEIYGAVFDDNANPLSAEVVAPFAQWMDTLPLEETSFVFTDAAPFAPALDASRFAAAPRISAGRALAGAIARLAWSQAKDPALLDANYVRKSDAELFWVDR